MATGGNGVCAEDRHLCLFSSLVFGVGRESCGQGEEDLFTGKRLECMEQATQNRVGLKSHFQGCQL